MFTAFWGDSMFWELRLQGYLELGRIYNLVKVRPY
jgi:hypothetical protein